MDACQYFVRSMGKSIVTQIDATQPNCCPTSICRPILSGASIGDPTRKEIYQHFANAIKAGSMVWPVAEIITFFKRYPCPERNIRGIWMDGIVESVVTELDDTWSGGDQVVAEALATRREEYNKDCDMSFHD